MMFRNISILLLLAILLLANGAAATKCVVLVTDEYKMTDNGARIYHDDTPRPMGTTAYNTGLGSNCWIGNLDLTGTHQLTAKWERVKPNPVSYQGSATVEFIGDSNMRITIPTHRA